MHPSKRIIPSSAGFNLQTAICTEAGKAIVRSICAALLLIVSIASSAATIGAGFSGMWYDVARSGEGLQLEILDANNALVEWFTYDEQGKQRWLQGVGQIKHDPAGDSIDFPQMYVTHGGKFGPGFDPKEVKVQPVGSVSLSFNDCASGTFHYAAFGQSQTLPITRLTQAMGAGCQPINGVVGQPVEAYAGQSGSWYNTSRSGEGFDLQWLANGSALVTWYTYDTAGNQVWLLGVGTQQDGAIVFPQMAVTSGPRFGTAYKKEDYAAQDWGSLTLRIDCNGGSVHYASNRPEYGSGDVTLVRLTKLQKPACPYVQPKLTELYNFTWEELPIEAGTPIYLNATLVSTIAADGTVAGKHNGNLVLWHPDTQMWEEIPRELYPGSRIFISPDGSKVIATDNANPGEPVNILQWQRASGWLPLPGDVLNVSTARGVSKNFQFIVGAGYNFGGIDQALIRTIEGPQRLLPVATDIPVAYPIAVSNDGAVVVGNALRFMNDFPIGVAMRWIGEGQPSILHDPVGHELANAEICNADCSIAFGTSFFSFNPSQTFPPFEPHQTEAWFLKSDGKFGYLGTLPDTDPVGSPYYAEDTTSDGSLVVGIYVADKYPEYHASGNYATRPFIWTPATGMVSVRTLVTELGIGDDDWKEVDTVRLSPDGLNVLIGGFHMPDLTHSRAVVLHLTPKVGLD